MIRWAVPVGLILVLGCSDLVEGVGGVVELDIITPSPPPLPLEVGETVQLTARALDKDGNEISTPLSWRAADTTVTVDGATGLVTGAAPGSGRVQVFAGTLGSPFVSFNVTARADTLIIVGDSVVTVGPGVASSTPLVTQLQSFSPPSNLPQRPVIYAITWPPDVPPHSVVLAGGVLVDTLATGADGTVQTAVISRVDVTIPDSAVVEVRAFRTGGAAVPGSGQRFIVRFQ